MDEMSIPLDSLEAYPGCISQKFSGVLSSGYNNGEIFNCDSADELDSDDPPYFTKVQEEQNYSSQVELARTQQPLYSGYTDRNGRNTYDRGTIMDRCKTQLSPEDLGRLSPKKTSNESERLANGCRLNDRNELLTNGRMSERICGYDDRPYRPESSRATMQPKGLHTHVLNCSGLRPRRTSGLSKSICDRSQVFHACPTEQIPCSGTGLPLRDKIDHFPHVCGKDNPLIAPAESSTSSDQEFPVSRIPQYKKKTHKNSRAKNSRKPRNTSSRTGGDRGFTCRDSEDSSAFSKSDSESKYSSVTSRVPKVSISNSAEILYEESGSFKYIPPSACEERPLKSALKMSQSRLSGDYEDSCCSSTSRSTSTLRFFHPDDNYRRTFATSSHELSRPPPKPSLDKKRPNSRASTQPVYRAFEDISDVQAYESKRPLQLKSKSLSVFNLSSIGNSKSSSPKSQFVSNRKKANSATSSVRSGSTDLEDGFTTIRRNSRHLFKQSKNLYSSRSMSNLTQVHLEQTSDFASEALSDSMEDVIVRSPSLGDWHEALAATSKLGWTLLLYSAVRNNYKPLQFAQQLLQGSRSYVRALADYQTRESRLLSFSKGDIIRVTDPEHYHDKGWLEGSVDGRTGLFPVEYVAPIGRAEARLGSKPSEAEESETRHPVGRSTEARLAAINSRADRDGSGDSNSSWGVHQSTTTTTTALHNAHINHHDDSGHSSGGEGGVVGERGGEDSIISSSHKAHLKDGSHDGLGPPQYTPAQFNNDGKHSLLQFALKYFRVAKDMVAADGTLQANKDKKKKKSSKDNAADWTWKEQVEMVKFSQSPLTASLLPLEQDISHAAVEVFLCVMRYMGDYPMDAGQTEVHCIYTILMHCHMYEALRDELYCQIMKQTTSNKSSIPDSCQRGWRLFSIIAAYFVCSDILRPYLFKYLETNAYDKRRAFHGTAMVTLQNLRKTFKYGGRKNVPSVDEITALTAGRNSKREIYRLPGGTERVINTRSTSVVQDILEEMCEEIGVTSSEEQEEFGMYCLVEGQAFTMPLARDEYILDVTTELRKNNQVFFLIFCRSVWYCPLRLDTPLYVEVVFNQVAPDYLEGLLLVSPGEHLPQHLVMDIAKIAALMHRAADLDHEPAMREVKYLLPRKSLLMTVVRPQQWVNMVQGAWPEAAKLSTTQAKAQVMGK
ncbi:SH3 domain [Trinorchestia longiramus]|nr:SH3 domain [Trinorchestia longiramus]